MDILSILGLITVEPILFLYMLASFTQMAVMQDFIYAKVCLNSDFKNSCSEDAHNQSLDFLLTESNHWLLYNNIALTLPAIFTSLYLGSWCCHYGPKLPLLLPSIGAIISCVINIVLSVIIDSNVGYLLLSQLATGIFGSSICIIMACMSYVSLRAVVNNRTVRFVILESMIFLGGTIGPFIGGLIKTNTGFIGVFGFLLCIYIVIFTYAFFRIRNIAPSDADEDNDEVKLKTLNFKHCLDTLTTSFRKRNDGKRRFILLLLVCAFLNMVCTAGELDTTYYYTKDEPLSWTYEKYSYYFGVRYCVIGLGLLIIAPLLRRLFDPKDTIFVFLGFASKIAALTFLAFSTTTLMMFIVPIIAILSGFPMPTLRSMLSKLMEKNEHGKLFAFIASLEQLCFLFGSVIFNALYPATRSFVHGFVFFMSDVFLFIALVILAWIHIVARRRNVQVAQSNSDGVEYRQI